MTRNPTAPPSNTPPTPAPLPSLPTGAAAPLPALPAAAPATRRLWVFITVLLFAQFAFGVTLLIWTLCTHDFAAPPPPEPTRGLRVSAPLTEVSASKPLAMQNYQFTWDGRAADQFLCFWWTLHALVGGLVWVGVKRNPPTECDSASLALQLYLLAVPTLQAGLYLIYFLLFLAPVWFKYGPRLDIATGWTALSLAIALSLHAYYRHRPSRQPDPQRDAAWQGRFDTGLEDVDRGEHFDQGRGQQSS